MGLRDWLHSPGGPGRLEGGSRALLEPGALHSDASCVGVCERADLLHRELAGTGVTPSGCHERRRAVLNLGNTPAGQHRRDFVVVSGVCAGVQDQPVRTGHTGSQEGIGVHLSALGVAAVFGVPGVELANRCVDLAEILGHDGEALMDKLSGVTTPRRRITPVEAALAERLGRNSRLAPEVVWVWGKLRGKPSARVAELAAEIGWSRTRLASRFSE